MLLGLLGCVALRLDISLDPDFAYIHPHVLFNLTSCYVLRYPARYLGWHCLTLLMSWL